MLLGDRGAEIFHQVVVFPFLQHQMRALFAAQAAQLLPGIFGRDALLQFAFNRQVEPFLGARFQLESHARGQAQRAQQAHRLIREAVNRQRADFAVLDVRQSVGGIEQQSARSRIQRDGNRIQRKIAPPQIFHDGGPAHLRPRAGTNVVFIARGGDAALDVARRTESRRGAVSRLLTRPWRRPFPVRAPSSRDCLRR